MELPYTLTNDSVLDADELQANLEVLRDGLAQIRNANIVAAAGIDKTKLAQPMSIASPAFMLVPATANASLDTAADAGFTLPAAHQTKARQNVRLAAGQLAALCALELFVEEAVADSGTLPEYECLVDGVQLMGQVIPIAATTSVNQYLLGNLANPVTQPAYPLDDGSIIQHRLRRDGAGTACTIRQVSVVTHIKADHLA